ncbi:MAG: hypothetical protein EXS16_08700 [Gemmataceae bacterium]|nr:hypothetical protein [Gemmataceae bacterium]
MYRPLGIFWFAVGVGLLTLQWTMPTMAEYPMMVNRVPLGALALTLSFYNTIRWRMLAARIAAREQEHAEQVKQRFGHGPIDPNFDFSEPPKDTKPK